MIKLVLFLYHRYMYTRNRLLYVIFRHKIIEDPVLIRLLYVGLASQPQASICSIATTVYFLRPPPHFYWADGVSAIFLRVHISKNELHKPTHTFGERMVNKKYVFNYY
jgi:hypothetical protein